jgi:hypothetical protein
MAKGFEKGKLHIDDTEAEVERSIYDHYLSGQTMEMIAWGLNRDGAVTRTENDWTVWSIGRILHNPVYAGYLRWDDLVIPSDHAPIVSADTFNKVQVLAASKVKNSKRSKPKFASCSQCVNSLP